MELLDSDAPAFAMGAAIDKFLFLPGSYIPSTFSPTSDVGRREPEDHIDARCYQEEAVDSSHLSDYPPVLPPIPGGPEGAKGVAPRRIRGRALSEET